MSQGFALFERVNHRLLRRVQVVTQRQVGVQIAAADEGAEDGHMFINGDDIALLKIALIPLVVEVEDNGNDFK